MEIIAEQCSNLGALICVTSIFLFLNAKNLVRSLVVFYTGGILAGIFVSFLALGFFLQRLIPRTFKLPFFLGGWPLSAYIYYLTWKNLTFLLKDYQLYVVIYLCFVTLLSLAICYRLGPPADERSLNLAEWALQLLALATIYFSIQNQKLAISIIVLLLLFAIWIRFPAGRLFCRKLFRRIRTFLFGIEPRRLLTEQEYLDESIVYTRMELDKLRQFCQSQDSKKNWRLISRLHTPNRMASFITGDVDHVSNAEASYHSELYDFDDDENSSEEDDSASDEGGYITNDDD